MSDSTPVAKTIEFKVKNEAGSLMNALRVFSVSFNPLSTDFHDAIGQFLNMWFMLAKPNYKPNNYTRQSHTIL